MAVDLDGRVVRGLNIEKEPVWSLHITADDRYKASFTYEDGTLYFRTCGIHDTVDKHP